MDGELEHLGERIAEQAAHLDAATHRLLVDLREFDKRGGWHRQGALSCAHWLSWRVGWSLVVSRDHLRVAHKLVELPSIDDALRRGEISYSKVRAMTRVATPANEQLLLEYARLMPAAQLEITCRKYAMVQRHGKDPHPLGDLQRRYVRRRDTEDGMVKIEAVLHPDEAEAVWTMLDHAATQLSREPNSGTHPTTASSKDSHGVSAPSQRRPSSGDTRGTRAAYSSAHETRSAAPPAKASAEEVVGDSAELQRKAASPCEGGAHPLGSAMSELADDSAESQRAARQARDAAAHPAAYAPDAMGPDSAESQLAATRSGEEGLHLETLPANRLIGDSAESQGIAGSTDAEYARRTPFAKGGRVDDSAESQRTAGSAAGGGLDVVAGDAAAERSLLDELLDELDATRRAEAELADNRNGDGDGDDDGDGDGDAEGKGVRAVPGRGEGPLQQRADAVKRSFSRADALVAVAQWYLRGDRPNRAPIEVTLTIPIESLRTGAGGSGGAADPVEVGQMGETFVSCEAARRLSCDCGVVEVVEDENGTPLSVGRKRRTITGQLKRALHARDKTCTFPGCTNRLFLEGHHIKHWVDGGETALSNAALLCSSHHHYVHEYGYTIELGADGRPQFRDRHGWLVTAVPERPVTDGVGWPFIRAQNAPLAIDAETIACEWDGRPVPYGAVIGHLVVADGLQ